MTALLEAFKTQYEDLRLTPEQIAEQEDLDLAAVKAGLMQCSSQYRRACNQSDRDDETLNFSNDDLRRVNGAILELALSADNEGVRLSAAKYVRDDKKGRNDVVKQVGGMAMNILQINQFMAKNRAMANDVKKQAGVVDIN